MKAGTYYSDAVRWAAANEIACGVTDTRFQPNGLMTREQMATFLYRYAKLQQEDTTATLTGFPDGASVSAWAKDAMQWAVGSGLIQGTEENGKILLNPQGNSTRAQVAVILMRFLEGGVQ